MVTNTIITSFLFAGLFLMNGGNCTAQTTIENVSCSIVKINENQQDNSIDIRWDNGRFDEIEIYNENGLFMPSMPISKINELHLNDLTEGNYFVNFKNHNHIIETKSFKVEQHNFMAKN